MWERIHTAGPGSPSMPLSPLTPGVPTIPRCPDVPAGPGGPSGPWQRNPSGDEHLNHLRIFLCTAAESLAQPSSYRGTVLSRVSLLSRAPCWAWMPPLSLTSMSSILSSNTRRALLSWTTDGPVWPNSTLKHTHDLFWTQILRLKH